MACEVALVVTLAAILHASWNALVKLDGDKLSSISMISISAAGIAALSIPFVGIPKPDAIAYLVISAILNTGYKLFLISAYRSSDIGLVYPIARGTAPVLTFFVLLLVFDEHIGPMGTTGVLVITGGIILMAITGGRKPAGERAFHIFYVLGTSIFISAYTVIDGLGARANEDAVGYAMWLFVINGVSMLFLFTTRRRTNLFAALLKSASAAVGGGAMIIGSYGLVIWAATKAPIALVASLRETSILYSVIIARMFLSEPLTMWRSISATIILFGIIIMRL